MKLVLSFFICAFFITIASAQNNVSIQINHLLDGVTYENEVNSANDLGHDFMLERLEYYLSNFKITHDGGQITTVEDLYVIISLLEDFEPTLIDLGNYAIQNIESVSFHLGIEHDANHADPSLWPVDHPLAPRWPAMHWGWAAGYRFIALEGMCGPSMNENLEFHVIGDEFFTEISFPVNKSVQDAYTIEINADYDKILNGIDISSGLILHGNLGEIKTVAINLSTEVFSLSTTTGVKDSEQVNEFSAYPNPVLNGQLFFDVETVSKNCEIYIYNAIGRQIERRKAEAFNTFNLANPGLYIASLRNQKGDVLASRKIIVQ